MGYTNANSKNGSSIYHTLSRQRRCVFTHAAAQARAHGLWPAALQPHVALVCRVNGLHLRNPEKSIAIAGVCFVCLDAVPYRWRLPPFSWLLRLRWTKSHRKVIHRKVSYRNYATSLWTPYVTPLVRTVVDSSCDFIIIIIIIIIIRYLYSAIMPLGGYRGAGGTGR